MRKFVYLCMLLGLGLSSCEKEKTTFKPEENVEIDGVSYSLSFLTDEMSKELSVNPNSLLYIHNEKVFYHIKYPETKWSVKKLLNSKNLSK